MQTAKAQISLLTHAVWSMDSKCLPWWVLSMWDINLNLNILHMSEDVCVFSSYAATVLNEEFYR